MSELSYTSYDYVGPVLDEAQFYHLKVSLQENRAEIVNSLHVSYLREVWRQFGFRIVAVAACGLITLLFSIFMPSPEAAWLEAVLYVSVAVLFFGGISLFISLWSFLRAVRSKRKHSALMLRLIETCPDHKTYLDEYYRQTL